MANMDIIPAPARKRINWGWHLENIASPVIFTVGLFVVWEAAVRLFSIPETILPTASATLSALWEFRAVILDNTIDIEGEVKPACTAEVLVLYFFED